MFYVYLKRQQVDRGGDVRDSFNASGIEHLLPEKYDFPIGV